jgi:hypothetical protein
MWQPFVLLLGILGVFSAWWLTLQPSNDRDWSPNSSVLSRVCRDGDVLTIENVRNTEYRTATDYTPHYTTKVVHLSQLVGVDLLLYYWGSPWMSHPTLIFDFGADGRVAISIEVRYRQGQSYGFLRSLYRQQELIYLVAEERDVILQQTQFTTGAASYLYHLQGEPEQSRTLFLGYVEVINRLYDRPQWYNGLTANCTTSLYYHPHSRLPLDWRMLINGELDRSLYRRGRLDRTLAFADLKRLSRINELVRDLPSEGFGDALRQKLRRQLAQEPNPKPSKS